MRERCKRLAGFTREAWPLLEPGSEYIHGWHLDAIDEHLLAVSKGQITRLIINVPPGTMKSLKVGVFWPAWEWGPGEMPHLRYLTTSYSIDYVTRDARKMRDLVRSEWYQDRWPATALTGGGKRVSRTRRGSREGTPFQVAYRRPWRRVIIDDPHSTETAESTPTARRRSGYSRYRCRHASTSRLASASSSSCSGFTSLT